jgi:GNAT superfamily N-acetyltransferase
MSGYDVAEVTRVDAEIVEAFARFAPAMITSTTPPTAEELQQIVDSDASVLLVARDPARDGRIVGSMSLVLFRVPTGVQAWIEDLAVDEEARGKGVGAALHEVALVRARQAGATRLAHIGQPSRPKAAKLYKRLGYEPGSADVYRYDIGS